MPRLEDVLADLAAQPHVRAAALAGFDGLLVDEAFLLAETGRTPALDGAVVELTHAWNGVRRACADYLDGGGARELIVVADGGLLLMHVVANAWFALLWADVEVDVERGRAALREASAQLAEVVA
jgi:predicted regulator of Ras-like GTPase activity (Roadblock/LC7/MglB family)